MFVGFIAAWLMFLRIWKVPPNAEGLSDTYGSDEFSIADYAKDGWVCILIAITYGLLVMAPWYAVLGLPVLDASGPWLC